MNKRKQYPSQARIRELFDYDPEGFLVWRSGPRAGSIAGSTGVNKDLRVFYDIRIKQTLYSGARLIWIYHYGTNPKIISHKDFNQSNNKIENLEGLESAKGRSAGHWKTGEGNYRFICKDTKGGTWYNTVGECRHFYSKDAAARFADMEIDRLGLYYQKNKAPKVNIETQRANGKHQIKNYKPDATSFYIGVSKHKSGWTVKCAHRYIGLYDNEEDAARAYNIEAKKNYGENAEFNYIDRPFEAPGKKRRKTSSGYTGVYQRGNKFYARVNRKNLGTYDTKEQAARAYNIAAYEHYGEQAVLNDVPDPLGKGDVF